MSLPGLVLAWALAAASPTAEVPGLLRTIENGNRPAVDQAVNRIQFLGVPRLAVTGLVQMARSPDPAKRQNAGYALSVLHPPEAEPALVELLSDESTATRLLSCQGLAQLPPDKSARAALAAQMSATSAAVRRECAHTLGQWHEGSQVGAVIKALGVEKDPDARVAELEALGLLGKASAAGALEPHLKDPSEEARYAAAKSLAQLGSPAGKAYLTMQLAQPDAFARADAADIVGQLDLPWARDSLAGLLKDPSSRVCVRAARSLAARRDPRGVEALVLRAEKATGDERADYEGALSDLGVTQAQRLAILQSTAAK